MILSKESWKGKTMKIAICDDDAADLKLMQSYCSRYDSTIPTAAFTSGEALLEAYGKDFYDLVFLDIEMGQLNGLELGAPAYPPVPRSPSSYSRPKASTMRFADMALPCGICRNPLLMIPFPML